MLSPERYAQLVQAYSVAAMNLTSNLISWALRTWTATPESAFYDDNLVLGNAARSATLSEASGRMLRQSSQVFHKKVMSEMDEGIDLTIGTGEVTVLPRNADSLEVWTRPAEQYRYARSQGKSHEEALSVGLARVEQLASMNNTLEAREASREIFMASTAVIGYRRIIHPELTRSGTCGLCAAASTRMYEKAELLPIHQGCVCTIAPVTESQDPGAALNEADLKRLYEMAGGTFAEQLSRVRYRIDEHGELGPTLVDAGKRVAQPRSRAREAAQPDTSFPSKLSAKDMYKVQLEALTISLAQLQRDKARGKDVDQAIMWQRDRISLLRQRLGVQ